jgi:hypothetical protein
MTTTDTEGAGNASADERGAPVSPELRRKLLAQLRAIHEQAEVFFDGFLEDAKAALPEERDSPRFPFVVRRLWQQDDSEFHGDWRETIRNRYLKFEREFDWSVPPTAGVDERFWTRSLSVWQNLYYEQALKSKHILGIIRDSSGALGL